MHGIPCQDFGQPGITRVHGRRSTVDGYWVSRGHSRAAARCRRVTSRSRSTMACSASAVALLAETFRAMTSRQAAYPSLQGE